MRIFLLAALSLSSWAEFTARSDFIMISLQSAGFISFDNWRRLSTISLNGLINLYWITFCQVTLEAHTSLCTSQMSSTKATGKAVSFREI